MGVILLFQLTQPNANLWSTTTVNFGLPYWSISTGLNVLVTILIVGRLFVIRRRTRAALSNSHSRTYTSIAAMLIESAALYTSVALIFIVTYARNSDIQNLVLPVLGQVQAISPLLIMWRVARGQAISRETMASQNGHGASASVAVSKIQWKQAGTTGATTAATPSVSLPAFNPVKQFAYSEQNSTKTVDDSDSWELSEQKHRGVEVVVERHVERWETVDRVGRSDAV